MNCPDRALLFAALEERLPDLDAHLDACPHCRALADEERALSRALGGLRDPAPPPDLMGAIFARIEATETRERAWRRQASAGFALALAVMAALAAALWRDLLRDVVTLAGSAVDAASALLAIDRTLGDQLAGAATALLFVEALALVATTLVFHRLLAPAAARS